MWKRVLCGMRVRKFRLCSLDQSHGISFKIFFCIDSCILKACVPILSTLFVYRNNLYPVDVRIFKLGRELRVVSCLWEVRVKLREIEWHDNNARNSKSNLNVPHYSVLGKGGDPMFSLFPKGEGEKDERNRIFFFILYRMSFARKFRLTKENCSGG